MGTLRQNIEPTTANTLSVFWQFSMPLGSSFRLCCTTRKKALSLALYLSLQKQGRGTGGRRFNPSPLAKEGSFCG